MVVLPVLDMVATHDLDFTEIGVLFPLGRTLDSEKTTEKGTYIEKIDFFEELLLMILELANHVLRRSSWSSLSKRR